VTTTIVRKATPVQEIINYHFLPNVKHAYGTLSIAKQWNNQKTGTIRLTFFISLRAADHQMESTLFWQVTSGMEVAEKIS
jgi:peptidylprolyl isomerase